MKIGQILAVLPDSAPFFKQSQTISAFIAPDELIDCAADQLALALPQAIGDDSQGSAFFFNQVDLGSFHRLAPYTPPRKRRQAADRSCIR